MPVPDHDQSALREAYAASLYGFGSAYRRGDDFEPTLAAICRWAVEGSRYEFASVDVFAGDGPLTLAGRVPSRSTLDTVHAVLTGHPRRPFHALHPFPPRTDDPARPAAWAGATLSTPTGTVLGSLDLWSSTTVEPDDTTRERLPVLARAVMHVLEEQRRILAGRAVTSPGPRPVTRRRPDPGSRPEPDAPGADGPS